MEDVLEVYTRPYDPSRPVVCLDEVPKQLVGEVRQPVPVKAGRPARYDAEYKRNGVCNVFMCYEPLAGKRQAKVTDRRTGNDWAEVIRELVDVQYPQAEKIVLVMDQLNTHSPASLYGAFPPEEARKLSQKLEIHYTPKHGSWLNMAEIELSVLSRQCLNRRIANRATLQREVRAWQVRRDSQSGRVDWRFTTADARIKLKHLYPSVL